MQNGEIADKFTKKEVREMVKNAWDNKDNEESLEEFEERVGGNIKKDAQKMYGARGM